MSRRNKRHPKFVQHSPMDKVFRESAQFFSEKYRHNDNPAILMVAFEFDEGIRSFPETEEKAKEVLRLLRNHDQMDRWLEQKQWKYEQLLDQRAETAQFLWIKKALSEIQKSTHIRTAIILASFMAVFSLTVSPYFSKLLDPEADAAAKAMRHAVAHLFTRTAQAQTRSKEEGLTVNARLGVLCPYARTQKVWPASSAPLSPVSFLPRQPKEWRCLR